MYNTNEEFMQINLLWTGLEYYSLENCLVTTSTTGVEIDSVIVGKHENAIYRVEYILKTNHDWETISAAIKCYHNNTKQFIEVEGDGRGNWMRNGQQAPELEGCIDVDIPLTPFTNTLPIRRLALRENESREIRVIYFDLLKQQVKPAVQRYSCLSKTGYHYENVPNDFEATIEVDEYGLVVVYPQLFTRTAITQD